MRCIVEEVRSRRRNAAIARATAAVEWQTIRCAKVETPEMRVLLSRSNAIDTGDFGNFASESVHSFDAGFLSLPLAGIGVLGQTYRAPVAGGPTVGTNNDS